MGAEIADLTDARTRIRKNFRLPSGHENYLEDYAKIAVFLTNEADFKAALQRVSVSLWASYRGYPKNQRNKFTSAFGSVAIPGGFTYTPTVLATVNDQPNGLVFSGGVSADKFAECVTGKLFWKDDMNLRHGEHSHSLQWLAIAEANNGQELNLTAPVPDLYATTMATFAKGRSALNPAGAGTSTAEAVEKGYLWSWLVDCVMPNMVSRDVRQSKDENTVSDSFRSPQKMMDMMMKGQDPAVKGWFITRYLKCRYHARGWLKMQEKEIQDFSGPNPKPKKEIASFTEGDPRPHARTKHANPAWQVVEGGQANTATAFQRAPAPLHNPLRGVQAKKEWNVTCHGHSGTITSFV